MCGGEWYNMIYKIECGGWPFAWPLIYGVAGVSAVYLVLGVGARLHCRTRIHGSVTHSCGRGPERHGRTGMRLSSGGGVGPPNPEFWVRHISTAPLSATVGQYDTVRGPRRLRGPLACTDADFWCRGPQSSLSGLVSDGFAYTLGHNSEATPAGLKRPILAAPGDTTV